MSCLYLKSVLCFRDHTLMIINPGLGDKIIVSNTDTMLQSFEPTESEPGKNVYIYYTKAT
jgi:hypothetical protein